jgi:predicted transcriptional regulator
MDLRRYRPLHAAGATYTEIAAELGVDWRTVRKYLVNDPTFARIFDESTRSLDGLTGGVSTCSGSQSGATGSDADRLRQ